MGWAEKDSDLRSRRTQQTSNKCIATSNKCIATSNKCLTSSNKCLTSSNKCLTSSNKCLTSSNKCLTSSNKKTALFAWPRTDPKRLCWLPRLTGKPPSSAPERPPHSEKRHRRRSAPSTDGSNAFVLTFLLTAALLA